MPLRVPLKGSIGAFGVWGLGVVIGLISMVRTNMGYNYSL